MRISLNLASRPFVELRPLFARLRIAMVVLMLLAIGLGAGLHSLAARAREAGAAMDDLKARTAVYQQERARNEARMRQPQNRAVLDRSQFLNALFARKSFSWTAVMMDLERVLPTGVQVTSIEPVISKEGDVTIRLRVAGDRDRAIQLVRNLERSQRFIAPRLGGETATVADKNRVAQPGSPALQNASEPIGNGVEFEIFSNYNPLPEPARRLSKTEAEAAGNFVPDDATAQPATHHDRHPRRSGAGTAGSSHPSAPAPLSSARPNAPRPAVAQGGK